MYVEVSVAINYLLSHLYTKLPRRRVDNFGEELEKCLFRKLQNHWFADSPNQDAAQRCFQACGSHTDYVFAEAAMASGLEWSEIQACLPPGLVLSIDPGHVSCQYGSNECSLGPSITAWGGSSINLAGLSSSGCSSASSVTSNASSSSISWTNTKHQVLYSANPRSGVSAQPEKEKETELSSPENRKTIDDAPTHLATEAALSVLTEPEEVPSSTITVPPNIQDQRYWNNTELMSGLGDSNGQQTKLTNQILDNKFLNFMTSTDAAGDGNVFEQMSNDSQAKSDIENQFPFNDFQHKSGRDLGGAIENDMPSFDIHTGQVSHPLTQTSVTTQENFNQSAPNFGQKSTSAQSFTAASFAATKFGSTKLKSQTKRPHRLVSPGESSNVGYPSQLLDSTAQTPVSANAFPNCDRLMLRPSESLRNGSSVSVFYGNHAFASGGCGQTPGSNSNSFYGGFGPGGLPQQFDRENCVAPYGNNFIENAPGLDLSGNNTHSRNDINSPMWSQFEKIRNEFQLKNGRYVEQQQQQQQKSGSQVQRPNSFLFNPESVRNAVGRSSFQQTDTMLPAASKEGNGGFGDDLPTSFNYDAQDLWSSQKFGCNSGGGCRNGFCWGHEVTRSPLEFAKLGPAFNALNISEH